MCLFSFDKVSFCPSVGVTDGLHWLAVSQNALFLDDAEEVRWVRDGYGLKCFAFKSLSYFLIPELWPVQLPPPHSLRERRLAVSISDFLSFEPQVKDICESPQCSTYSESNYPGECRVKAGLDSEKNKKTTHIHSLVGFVEQSCGVSNGRKKSFLHSAFLH